MKRLIRNVSEYVEEIWRCIRDASEKCRVQYAGSYSDTAPLHSQVCKMTLTTLRWSAACTYAYEGPSSLTRQARCCSSCCTVHEGWSCWDMGDTQDPAGP